MEGGNVLNAKKVVFDCDLEKKSFADNISSD